MFRTNGRVYFIALKKKKKKEKKKGDRKMCTKRESKEYQAGTERIREVMICMNVMCLFICISITFSREKIHSVLCVSALYLLGFQMHSFESQLTTYCISFTQFFIDRKKTYVT